MTREEIEQIIVKNIRTNGRGEITAKVMAGVLQSFVEYTDTQADTFAALCRALADAFTVLVEQQASDFTSAVEALEARFEGKATELEGRFEEFCEALLNDNFKPWAEALDGHYTELAAQYVELAQSLSDKYEDTAAGIDEALVIIREGNKNPIIVIPNGMKLGYSTLTEYPADKFDFSAVEDWDAMFADSRIVTAPKITIEKNVISSLFRSCVNVEDVSNVKLIAEGSMSMNFLSCSSLKIVPAGVVTVKGQISNEFSDCPSLKSVHVKLKPDTNLGTVAGRITSSFTGCASLEEVSFDLSEFEPGQKIDLMYCFSNYGDDKGKCTLPANLLERCLNIIDSLGSVETIPDFDGTNNGSINQSEVSSLKNVGLISNWSPGYLNLSGCHLLTTQSLQNIVNSLPQLESPRTITVSAESLALMQAAGLVDVANAKGWTVTA